MKVNTRQAAFEFLSIVVAVVLAMTLTEWRQDHLNRKLAAKSFDNIATEIRENIEELRGDSARIAKDLQFMSTWVINRVEKKPNESFKANFRLSILSTAAYEVAKVNQSLTHLSNEQNMDIATLYALQDFYTDKASEVFNLMGNLQGEVINQESDAFFKLVQKMRYNEGLVFNTIKSYISGSEEFLAKYAKSDQ